MSISIILFFLVLIFSATDLELTTYYIQKYRKWQPTKPYKTMEKNVLLLFFWNKYGFKKGMLIGGAIIILLNAIIAFFAPVWLLVIMIAIFTYQIFSHIKHIKLLKKLIKKYPSGHLPEKVFGKVKGNNPESKGGNSNE